MYFLNDCVKKGQSRLSIKISLLGKIFCCGWVELTATENWFLRVTRLQWVVVHDDSAFERLRICDGVLSGCRVKKKRGSNQNTRKSRNLSKTRVQIFSNFPFLYFFSFNRILCAMAQQLLFKFSLWKFPLVWGARPAQIDPLARAWLLATVEGVSF